MINTIYMANIGASQIIPIAIAIFLLIAVIKTARIVPQRESYVIERLGKYSKTLGAGFHFLIPFVDKVAYKHSLKEIAMDVPPQNCITKDNITIEVDGVLYMQVLDPKKASYGIDNYFYASTQLAQTTLRSEIGKLELDRTFEERDTINSNLIEALDKASDPWGIKITRYEIANISPPQSVKEALEKQMRAERERRAVVAHSEGEREAQINVAGNRRINFSGFRTVDEKKFSELDDKIILDWHKKGWLPFIYAHLFSGAQWQNLSRLLSQRLEKEAA